MVTFGVAPAVLVAVMAHHMRVMSNTNYLIVCGLAAVYLGGAALRLATYNVHAMLEKKSSDKFAGLPSPGGAAAICSIVIFCDADVDAVHYLSMILPTYAAVLGLLMVSSIPYIHVGKWLFSIKRNKRRLIIFLIVFLLVFIFRLAALVTLINIYVLSGPAIALWDRINKFGGSDVKEGREEQSCKNQTI
jgi:CDP-diacylglycerol--serine O-phosphatidyltransferase